MKTFTKEELAKYDGLEGRAPYVVYMGKVYDMTAMPEADHGDHFGHPFGLDLTDEMDDAPHGDNLIFDYPVVGVLKG